MAKEKKFITCDGNEAAAHVSYMFSEVAAIYPIRGWCCRCCSRFFAGWCSDHYFHCISGLTPDDS